ncbi:MAG TPA: SCO family protein [Pyrinomonadaceae bacterium]|jgi:protein SCO1/2
MLSINKKTLRLSELCDSAVNSVWQFFTAETQSSQRKRRGKLVCLAFSVLLMSSVAHSQPGTPGPSSPLYGARPDTGATSSGLPTALKDVRIEQKLNQQLPLDLTFRDESGQAVKLGQFFGRRPVVLSLVYYSCPMLCTQVLNGMLESIRVLPFELGKDYDVVTISFDPRETPQLAESKKKIYVGYLPEKMQASANAGWHFLTADPETVRQITDAVGFRYHYDESTKQFAHASGIMIATPQGKLSRYYYGITYSARDMRLGLIESSENKIGTAADELLLYCYHYDPAKGKYGAAVMNIIRAGGLLTLIIIAGMFFVLRRRTPAQLRLKTGGAAT